MATPGKIAALTLCLTLLISCGGPDDVWENYDYRDNEYYPQYEDNDDTYVIPNGSGICNDGSSMSGCD